MCSVLTSIAYAIALTEVSSSNLHISIGHRWYLTIDPNVIMNLNIPTPKLDLITKKCGKIGDGFIVLSEILMWIHRMNYKISEKETIFKNRVRGESSVGFNEISKSLVGLLKIFIISKIN